MEQHFIEDSLIILTKPTIDRLLKEDNCSELIALYTFYYYTAKWQKTNQPRCTTAYTAKALHWKEDKVRKHKKKLAELGLIEDTIQRDKHTNKISGHYITVKFVIKQKDVESVNAKETTSHTPPNGRVWKSGETNALSNNKQNALSNGNFSTSPCDAPIPAESVRNEKTKSLWDISREMTGNDPFTFPYQPTSDSEEKSAAGIVKKKPLVKNLTDKTDKEISLERAALLGKTYGMAIKAELQLGLQDGMAVLTLEEALDCWLDNALYRESAREAYLSKFLQAWENICDNCADRFWMPVRGGEGYVWQNVIRKYAREWNPGTLSERREAKAKEIL